MEELHLQFLIACHELVVRRRPLIADLAARLDVRRDELFHYAGKKDHHKR
jgi:hypothetical protein